MLLSEHHEPHHSPVSTPDAPPQARMKPSTSSPARSSTASADSGAYFARNSTSFAPLPDCSAEATPKGSRSSFGSVNSPSNSSSSNETIGYCFWPLRLGPMLFFAGVLLAICADSFNVCVRGLMLRRPSGGGGPAPLGIPRPQ